MKSNWKMVPLGNVCEIKNGYAFKSKDFSPYGIPVIKIKNVKPNQIITNDFSYVPEAIANAKSKWLISKDEILLTMTGNRADGSPESWVGKAARFTLDGKYLLNQRVSAIKSSSDELDTEYLGYYLSSWESQLYFIKHSNSSGGQANISPTIVKEYNILLPPIDKQKQIVSILRSLDDKIELNNKINENLEQQAQAIYQEWFVSQVDGHPDNYRKVSLADLMDYAGGSQPPASEFISEEREGYIRFVQIRDYESDSHLTYIPISTKNKICNEFDIMIARYGAALGRICFGLNGAYNVALAKVIPKQTYYREFLRCYLSSRIFYEGINNKGGRSAQAGFNQSDIKSFELFVPQDESVFHMFDAIVKPVFEYRLQLIKENQELTLLRDALLPSLMAGKIDVSSICC